MSINTLALAGLVLLVGLLAGRLVTFIHLPNVTGYLLGGLLFGPSILNIFTAEAMSGLGIVSEMALAFIAFTIGLSFKKSYLKRMGLTPVVIAVMEASMAAILVFTGMTLFGVDLPMAIVMGAIAAATAPAATVMVLREYNAKGPVSEMLLSVVALDDAVALILFGFAASIAGSMTSAGADQGALLMVLEPLWEVVFALLIGGVVGYLMTLPYKIFRTRGNKLTILISFVFIASGLASVFGVSELLACMMAGAFFTNFSMESSTVADLTDEITPPLFLMFFVVSGAQLNLSVLPTVGVIGAVYIVFRIAGKLIGAYTGARIMKTSDEIRKYLGLMILPQAGVAIGLSTIAERLVPAHGTEIKTIILAATLVFELIGPVLAKTALQKAGEIKVAKK